MTVGRKPATAIHAKGILLCECDGDHTVECHPSNIGDERASPRSGRILPEFFSNVKLLAERHPFSLETVKHQAERVAQGQKARGRTARSDVPAHLAQMEQMRRVSEGCAYLFSELHRLLQTGVPASHPGEGILGRTSRQSELETVLLLLAELGQQAPAPLQREIERVHQQAQTAQWL